MDLSTIHRTIGDWKEKRASQNPIPTEKEMAEVFSQQAETLVSNKLGNLMSADHLLGFEVIKSDDDYTQMIGIFGFKAGGDLLFAPVFFSNGDIKGTDLLYRNATKTFVPATKEWADSLIEKGDIDDGRGIDKAERGKNPPLVDMRRIAFLPPSYAQSVKMASEKTCEDCKDEPNIPEEEKAYSEQQVSESAVKNLIGDGKDRKMSDGTPFLNPPGDHEKEAFHKAAAATKYSDLVNDLVQGVVEYGNPHQPGLLKNLLDSSEQSGEMMDLIRKTASTSPEFAEMLAQCYPDPAVLWESTDKRELQMSKKASAGPEECLLTLHYGNLHDGVKSAGERVFTDGFYLEDKRPMESMNVVIDDMSTALQTVGSSPGVYDIITLSGEVVRGIAASKYEGDFNVKRDGGRYSARVSEICDGSPVTDTPVTVVIDGELLEGDTVIGAYVRSMKSEPKVLSEMEAGKAYMILLGDDGAGSFIGPIAVTSKKKVGDVTRYMTTTYSGDKWVRNNFDMWGQPIEVTANMELRRSQPENGLLGRDASFVEVKVDKDRGVGRGLTRDKDVNINWRANKAPYTTGSDALNRFVENTNVRTLAAKKLMDGTYDLSDEDYIIERITKSAAVAIIARDFNVPAQEAMRIMDRVDGQEGSYRFNVLSKEPNVKIASRLRVVDTENFEDTFDSQFGISMQPPRSVALRTTITDDREAPSRIGDAWDPTSANGLPTTVVMTTAPSKLQEVAKNYKLPHVFDHGVVGVLSNTFDCVAAMEKYLPALEKGVDAKGRTLFLFYVKPSDFEEAYGINDMINLENKLISDFKQDGLLLLDLSQRTIDRQKGISKKPVVE